MNSAQFGELVGLEDVSKLVFCQAMKLAELAAVNDCGKQ